MARAHHQEPEPEKEQPRPAPRTIPVMPPMGAIITDRNLMDQLRQIYQVAQRHKPMPPSTNLNDALLEALSDCADIAEKAVSAYKG